MRPGNVGVEADGFLVFGDGAIVLALVGKRNTQVDVRVGIVRFEWNQWGRGQIYEN